MLGTWQLHTQSRQVSRTDLKPSIQAAYLDALSSSLRYGQLNECAPCSAAMAPSVKAEAISTARLSNWGIAIVKSLRIAGECVLAHQTDALPFIIRYHGLVVCLLLFAAY